MNLDVSKAFVRPMTEFPFETEVALPPQDVNGDQISFDAVKLSGTYVMNDDVITLQGDLQTTAYAPCARCMEKASAPIEVSFSETFRKDADEEEDGCFRYENKLLPLERMTLTLVLLNTPMRFACENDCTGGEGLTAWNEQATVWAETEEEPQGTYRPFEGLKQMLEDEQKKQ